MKVQNQVSLHQQLHELDDLYYTAPLAVYEAILQVAITQLRLTLPDFTVACAEIATTGSERHAHDGVRHVLLPVERRAR